jgi:hypothetical protein
MLRFYRDAAERSDRRTDPVIYNDLTLASTVRRRSKRSRREHAITRVISTGLLRPKRHY